jgi:branched-chain amino acid transport system permease protein
LVLGISRIINFAHGEFYMLGAFGIYWLSTVFGINYFLSMLISFAVLATLGLLVDRYIFRRVRGMFLPSVIVACGVSFIIPGIAMIVFGERDKYVTGVFTGQFSILGANLPSDRLVIILVSLVVMIMLAYFVDQTKLGKAMWAVAQDQEAAALQGINIDRICGLSMFIGCGLAAVAGALIAPIFVVSPFMGAHALFKGFIVILLGGVGSIRAVLVGGLLLGYIEAFGYTLIGTGTDIIAFVLLMIVLLFRPSGLMGKVWLLE